MLSHPSAQLWLDEVKASLRLGSPLILTNLAQIALLTTNVIYMGWLGKNDLAAGSLAGSLYQACMIFSLGLVSATIPMLATTLGKQRDDAQAVQEILRHGFLTAVLICIPFWILLWNADTLLLALGQNPDTVEHAMLYMRSLQWALLPYLGYIILRSLLATLEQPVWALIVATSAIVLNAFLGWVLVFGNFGFPALGIQGAGISSTLSSVAMLGGMIAVIRLNPSFRHYAIFTQWWHLRWSKLLALLRLGIPIAITFTLETLVFYAAVIMMGLIGEASLAAHAIAIQLCSISYMFPLGFGQVATIRVGLAVGRANPIGATRAGWVSYALGVGCMGVAAILMWGAPEWLIHFFIDINAPENQMVVVIATQFIFLAALFQLTDGAQAVAAGMLRGLYDTRTPMLLALIGYWVIGMPIGALFAFGLNMGGVGIWIGLVCGLSITAVLLTLRWIKRSRRLEEQTYVH